MSAELAFAAIVSPALVVNDVVFSSSRLQPRSLVVGGVGLFGYTVTPALVINDVVFSSSCLQPEILVAGGVGVCSYTVSPAPVMNAVVFSSSCLQPRSLVVSGVGLCGYSQSSSGDECCRLLQLLCASKDSNCQRSCSLPHMLPLGMVEGNSAWRGGEIRLSCAAPSDIHTVSAEV